MSLQLAKYMIAGQGGKAPEEYWMAEFWKDTTSSFGSSWEFKGGTMQVSKQGDCYFTGTMRDSNDTPNFSDDYDHHLYKIDKKGDFKWHKVTYLHASNNPSSAGYGTNNLYLTNKKGNGGALAGGKRSNKLIWSGSLTANNNNYGGSSFIWDAGTDTLDSIRHGTQYSDSDYRWQNMCMTQDKDGNFRTCANQYNSELSNNLRNSLYINGAGNSIFHFREYNCAPRDIICDQSDNTYVCGTGYFGGTSNYSNQGWLIKLASGSSETISWYRRIWHGGYDGGNTGVTALRIDTNGKLYWSFGGQGQTNQNGYAVARIDPSNGNIERWVGGYDGQEYGHPQGRFDVDDDGNIYVLNSFLTKIELGSNDGDKPHYLLTKRNSSGVLQWERVILAQYRGSSATDTEKIIDKGGDQHGFGDYNSNGNYSIDILNDSIYLHLTSKQKYNMQNDSGGTNNYANNYPVNVIMKLPLDGSGHSTTPRALGRVQIIYAQPSDVRGSNITYDYGTGTSTPGGNYYWDTYDNTWQPTSDTTRGNGGKGLSTSYTNSNYRTTRDWNAGYNMEVGKYDLPD